MARISLPAAITLCAFLLATHKVTPLKIKTGLWEVTTIDIGADNMVPAALLEKLTPEQRARIQERMKASTADAVKMTVTKQCLTKELLESGIPFRVGGRSCTWTVTASASNKVELQGDCPGRGVKTEGTLRIEVLSPEETAGSVRFLPNAKSDSPETAFTFKAKWTGTRC
jgi:hypothetical protein